MNVSLTPELEQQIEDTVATGRYSSASEVVRASLRLFIDEERWKTYARAKVEQGLQSVAQGQVVEGKEAMRRIRAAAQRKK